MVGNFQRGLTNYDAVLLPNGHSAIVIAGGQGYLIDPKDRRLVGLFGAQLQNAMFLPDTETVVISNGLWLEGHGGNGVLWRTRRVSWDGIWDLFEDNGRLSGKCWDAVNDIEGSFSIEALEPVMSYAEFIPSRLEILITRFRFPPKRAFGFAGIPAQDRMREHCSAKDWRKHEDARRAELTYRLTARVQDGRQRAKKYANNHYVR